MRRAGLSTLLAIVALAVSAAPALAAFGLQELDVIFTAKDGSPVTQAGAHPFAMTTTLGVNTAEGPDLGEGPTEVPVEEVKNLTVEQVPGLAGKPGATPLCSAVDFNTRVAGRASCPAATAVGISAVKAEFTSLPVGTDLFLHVPVYNLAPPPGAAARLGFVALNVPVTIDVGISESPPYNVVASLRNIPQAILFYKSELTLWGNPADPAHDSLRGDCIGEPLALTAEAVSLGLCPVDIPEEPFLTLPRACQGPLSTLFSADSWQHPGAVVADAAVTHDDSNPSNPQGMTGCGKLDFGPTIEAKPSTKAAESATGLDFDLDIEDEGLTSPTGIADADIREVEVTLPEGVTVNPSAAEGLGVCTPADYRRETLGSAPGAGCPESSKLGTVQVKTPLLEETLEGALFLAQQDDPATAAKGAENPFDSLLALYLVIRNPQLGIVVKQAGKVEPDLRTGRLVSTFVDIPQFPLSHVGLNFREGPRSPLVTPPACGTYTTEASFTPWSGGAPVPAGSSFEIVTGPNGHPCPAAGIPPFQPGFEAGSLNNNAASYSPFSMRLTRQDGEQDMTRFDAILPPGVTGKLAGVTRCADAAVAIAKAKTGRQELAAPSCPAGSQIGSVLAGAGVGGSLTYVGGRIYLAGPYNGAPLSVIAITPAVAGPFDAGTVVVREALTLDPQTAEVQVDGAASDPIPHILEGIPLKVRDLRINVDRESFVLNPTSCDPSAVRATLFGSYVDVFSPADDVPVALADRFQAANCSLLGFKPKLGLTLNGGTRRGDHPGLKALYRPRKGDANLEGLVVRLPSSAFLDQAHIRTICTRVQFAADLCPKGAQYGHIKAWTPLLDEPLQGPVYLRSSNHNLPDLVFDLHGLVDVEVSTRIDSARGGIRATLDSAPDAPLTKVELRMQGGKKGLIVNSRDLCAAVARAHVRFSAHNGKRSSAAPAMRARCR